MANSIAKLAILLTADPSGLNSGMARAQQAVKGFNTNIGKSSTAIGLAFGKISLITAATAAIVGFAKASADAAKNLKQIEMNTDAAFNAAKAQLEGLPKPDEILPGTGRGSMFLAALFPQSAFDQIKDSFGEVAEIATMRDLGAETSGEFNKRIKEKIAATAGLVAEFKALEEAQKKAAEMHAKWLAGMKNRAENLTESLRTPVEVFADTVNELRELSQLGFIDPTTLTRGIEKAKKDLIDASKEAKKLRDVTAAPVAAAERFTMAGFSAVQSGRAELVKMLEAEKQQLAEEKKHTKLLEEANDLIRSRPPVIIKRNRL